MTSSNNLWHYIELDDDGKESIKGPFDVSALKTLYNNNAINEFTFLWAEGMPGWQQLKDLEIVHQVSSRLIIRISECA